MFTVELPIAVILVFFCLVYIADAQVKIPLKSTGIVYTKNIVIENSIVVDAFFDALCPDSRSSWPHLKKMVQHYHPQVFVKVHMAPMAFHTLSYLAGCIILMVENLNSSATFDVLEAFLENQMMFNPPVVRKFTVNEVIEKFINITTDVIGEEHQSALLSSFDDGGYDPRRRAAVKYATTWGVMATPFYFVNGFRVPGDGSVFVFKQWQSIIDELLAKE